MNDLRKRTQVALAKDCLEIEDYETGANLVFVDGRLLSDSDELPVAEAQVRRAREYGEVDCWIYTVSEAS